MCLFFTQTETKRVMLLWPQPSGAQNKRIPYVLPLQQAAITHVAMNNLSLILQISLLLQFKWVLTKAETALHQCCYPNFPNIKNFSSNHPFHYLWSLSLNKAAFVYMHIRVYMCVRQITKGGPASHLMSPCSVVTKGSQTFVFHCSIPQFFIFSTLNSQMP